MIKIAEIKNSTRGSKKVDFFELGIFKILKFQYGFRFQNINGKGEYLREINGFYEIIDFQELIDTFVKHIENTYQESYLSSQLDYESFINEFYHQRPIKKNSGWKRFLNEDFELTDYNLNRIKNLEL